MAECVRGIESGGKWVVILAPTAAASTPANTPAAARVPVSGLLPRVGALLLRCLRRLGGITGDVLGAAVEISFAVLVLAAATV